MYVLLQREERWHAGVSVGVLPPYADIMCRVHGEESLRRGSVPLTFSKSGERKVFTNVSLTKRKALVPPLRATVQRVLPCRVKRALFFLSLSLAFATAQHVLREAGGCFLFLLIDL